MKSRYLLSLWLLLMMSCCSFASSSGSSRVQVCDSDKCVSVDSNNNLNAVTHTHPDASTIHYHKDFSASESSILIDISDLTNYHHISTNYIHIDWISVEADTTTTANYDIEIGFLTNVDATNGDFYAFEHYTGTHQTGQNLLLHTNYSGNGLKCATGFITTHGVILNSTDYQTDVNLTSTLDPATANVPSGNGDVILRATITAGTVGFKINLGYHSH